MKISYIIQFKSFADNVWNTIQVMDFANFREASHYIGGLQKAIDEEYKNSPRGVYRAKPMAVAAPH
jgi:hypothetical protein